MTLKTHCAHLTDSLIVEEGAVLAGKVTECETSVATTVFYLAVRLTDLHFT